MTGAKELKDGGKQGLVGAFRNTGKILGKYQDPGLILPPAMKEFECGYAIDEQIYQQNCGKDLFSICSLSMHH
jgi:hypothetical protein